MTPEQTKALLDNIATIAEQLININYNLCQQTEQAVFQTNALDAIAFALKKK